MKILHFSHTPLAGAPYHIWHCLSHYVKRIDTFQSLNIEVDLCNYNYSYKDGRVFPYKKLWPINIHKYDVIHIHNQLPPYFKKELLNFNGNIFATLHSVPRLHNWKELIDFVGKKNTFVIKQPYQIQEYKKDGFKFLETPIDYWSTTFNHKKFKNITINFAPSNKLPIHHPASKGYNEVLKILNKIKQKYKDINILIYSNKFHLEDIALKCKSHIIIDDVIHPTFHLTSLFGLAGRSYVITGAMLDCFISSNLNNLETNLELAIDLAKNNNYNDKGVYWMEKNWNILEIVKKYINIYGGVI